MSIDLRTCQVGQKVERGDGAILEYKGKNEENSGYTHEVGEEWYTDDGRFFAGLDDNEIDIVRILPLEPAKPDKHPSVAAWESFPWITDRLPEIKDATLSAQVLVLGKTRLLLSHYNGVRDGEKWIHLPSWAPPKLTPQEKALALLEGKDDDWVPSAEEWFVFRKAIKP